MFASYQIFDTQRVQISRWDFSKRNLFTLYAWLRVFKISGCLRKSRRKLLLSITQPLSERKHSLNKLAQLRNTTQTTLQPLYHQPTSLTYGEAKAMDVTGQDMGP